MALVPQGGSGPTPGGRRRLALVLAGGAARGAYEVGVVRHVLEDVARSLGRPVPLDVLCGTSVGAINVCALAAWADDPGGRAARLDRYWTGLRIGDVVRPDATEVFDMLRALFGRPRPLSPMETRRGGIFDPRGLEQVIARGIRFPAIAEHLRAGRLDGLSVSATHVASGRTVVFVQRREPGLPPWGADPTTHARRVDLTAEHALASAAIPFLFPAVKIDGQFFSDGGLRQNVPLSPARRLGSDSMIVVNPRRLPTPDPELGRANEIAFPGPLFLLGKTLNALLLDRIDADIDRLLRINKLLEAGTRRYGAGFTAAINEEMGNPPDKIKRLDVVLVRATHDIGALAAEFVRSAEFRRHGHPGLLGRIIRRLADGEAQNQADFLSYVLFDGRFAHQLIELGRADAARQHEAICAVVETVLQSGR